MSDQPFIKFYPSDFLAGTSGLSPSERGIYITLLCLIYENDGPIVRDDARLSRRCGAPKAGFKRAIEALINEGKITQDGDMISNRRAEKALVDRQNRTQNATHAINQRWRAQKEKSEQNQSPQDTPEIQAKYVRDTSQKPEPDIRETVVSLSHSAPKPRRSDASRFDEFWDRYPRKVGKGAARKAYAKAVKAIDHDDLMFALSRQLAGMEAKEPQFRPHPATWLNSERWNDEPEPAHDPRGHMPSRPGSGMVDAFAAVAARRLARDGRG